MENFLDNVNSKLCACACAHRSCTKENLCAQRI